MSFCATSDTTLDELTQALWQQILEPAQKAFLEVRAGHRLHVKPFQPLPSEKKLTILSGKRTCKLWMYDNM